MVCLRRRRNDDIELGRGELRREAGDASVLSIGKTGDQHELLPLLVAELAHTLDEGEVAPGLHRRLARAEVEEPDAPGLSPLLSRDGENPGERARAQREQQRPARDHSITLSARTSIDCGIVTSIALAVFMLITSSNLVARSIGRSLGFAPLRILST